MSSWIYPEYGSLGLYLVLFPSPGSPLSFSMSIVCQFPDASRLLDTPAVSITHSLVLLAVHDTLIHFISNALILFSSCFINVQLLQQWNGSRGGCTRGKRPIEIYHHTRCWIDAFILREIHSTAHGIVDDVSRACYTLLGRLTIVDAVLSFFRFFYALGL